MWEEKAETLQRMASFANAHEMLVAGTTNDGHPGKWRKLREISTKDIDYYVVRSNEVAFDFDFKEWRATRSAATKILKAIDRSGYVPVVYMSGGKGCHIHIYFEDDASLTYLDYMRNRVFREIISSAGLRSFAGPRRPIDRSPVTFNSLRRGKLIRCPGGRKFMPGRIFYKTLVDELPNEMTRCEQPMDVIYPFGLPLNPIPDYADDFFRWQKEHENNDPSPVNFGERGGYFRLPCVKRILMNGALRGTRNAAGKTLAVAAILDKMSRSEFERWAKVAASKMPDRRDFDPGEMTAWYDWAVAMRTAKFWCDDAQIVRVKVEDREASACVGASCVFYQKPVEEGVEW